METIRIRSGLALIVGDEPLSTMFWESSQGKLYLVRIWCCEPTFDVDAAMHSLPQSVFDDPIEVLDFPLEASELALFDTNCPDAEAGEVADVVVIAPGDYRILTAKFQPDALTSLILHRFDRQVVRINRAHFAAGSARPSLKHRIGPRRAAVGCSETIEGRVRR